ncbi:MAG: tRNA (adenosine(37)-N6)-dimethylallyltransferase MiaA [Lachnospiraceae bacterium]|nr:tRNA (adenosine(37)-N6)-dimethylallyltransferase MiaA [Lachnospiraceae bacterium]
MKLKNDKPLVVLTGPTAVGKTKLSLELAKAIDGEIISADSMQVYKYMDIGTAKIMPDEMQGVRHHLIDIINPWEEFNVFKFKDKCNECIEDIYSRGRIPVIAGGTGFYIQAVLKDVNFTENETDTAYRNELQAFADMNGAKALHNMLRDKDPEAADEIHENNIKRIIRALEYYKLTGEKISNHNSREKTRKSLYNSCYFVLNKDRATLYSDIERRVDIMQDGGLLNEVISLIDIGVKRNHTSMQGIGYHELYNVCEKLLLRYRELGILDKPDAQILNFSADKGTDKDDENLKIPADKGTDKVDEILKILADKGTDKDDKILKIPADKGTDKDDEILKFLQIKGRIRTMKSKTE